MQKMIGYAQPTSCQLSSGMDCNGNSWAHQQKDQHTLEAKHPELAKLLDMDVGTSAIAQLQRVAANHLPDVSPGNHSLPQSYQEKLSRAYPGSPAICNNSVTTHPCQSDTMTSPSISRIKVANGPVIPLQVKKVTDVQIPLQNGVHLQNGDMIRNERLQQSGWSSRRKRETPERRTEMRATKDNEGDLQTKRSEPPVSPVDLHMSCDEDDLDDTQIKLNEEYAESLRKYQEEMARYKDELEKHFLAKHGLDRKRKAGSSKGGPEDVILISRGVQASDITEADAVIAPAIVLDLTSENQQGPSSPDSTMVIPTTQTKMHLSHSAPRNRFQRTVTCTTTSSDVLSPSGHQNATSPLTESALSPAMSSASSSQNSSPHSVNQIVDGPIPGKLQRDRRNGPSPMQQVRHPSLSNAPGLVQTNPLLNQGPPPLRRADEVQTGNYHQRPQPFGLVQPPAYPEIPPNMAIPGQFGGYPPPYAAGQASTRPHNQNQPSESGSSGSDLPPKGQSSSSKRRRRSSSGNRQVKRPKGPDGTQNVRVNVSQSGHTVNYRPEDQVTAHFEETYNRILQRNTPFSPPNITVRHPWQHPMPPYSGSVSQTSQQPSMRPTQSLLRDHLTRQSMWPFRPPHQQHQGTPNRMPHFHHDFNQPPQHPGGLRMPPPPPFHPENYNGHPPANHIGPFGGVERFEFHAGYRKQGDYQGMPTYLHGGSDKNQPANHSQGPAPDSHLMHGIGHSSPTYLPTEGVLQMYGGLPGSYQFPGFPLNGPPPLMGRPDGLPNSVPTSEPHAQSLPARSQEGSHLTRNNTVVRNSPTEAGRNIQPPQQEGSALPASDSKYVSRTRQSCRFSPLERQQPSISRKSMPRDDGKQSNSDAALDLSQPQEQEVMPQISKVHNISRQMDASDPMQTSPPESHQQEPVMPKIVSVTTERREHFPPLIGQFQDAQHHARNPADKTPCPPLVPGNKVTAGQVPRSSTYSSNKLIVPSVGSNSKPTDPAHSSGKLHHQPGKSQAVASVSETTTLSQHRILSVPRLIRNDRGSPRVNLRDDENNRSPGVSLPSKQLSQSTQEAVKRGANNVQPDIQSSAPLRREVNQVEKQSGKSNSASVNSSHTSKAIQRPMPALLRIPKIRKVIGTERSATKDANQLPNTAVSTCGSSTISTEQRDAAGTTGATTSSLGEIIASCVSGKNVSMPVAGPSTNPHMTPSTVLPNLVTSQVPSEASEKQQTSGTTKPFFAAFPSLCSMPSMVPTNTPLLSTGPTMQQNQVILASTVPPLPTIAALSVPTILSPPIVIPNSVPLMNSAAVEQPNIAETTNHASDQPQPQVIAGTVRSVTEEPASTINTIPLGLLKSKSQLDKYLDQTTSGGPNTAINRDKEKTPVVDPSRVESGDKSISGKENKSGNGESQGNKMQTDVQKEIVVTGATLITPRPSGAITTVHQETDESEEEVITIPVASVLCSPETGRGTNESEKKRNEDVNIFDQVATFVSSLEKQTDSSGTTDRESSKGTSFNPSHSNGPSKTSVKLNESDGKSVLLDATKSSSSEPSSRLKNCTLRLVPRKHSGNEEKKKDQHQHKHTSHTPKEKRRKDSHSKSSSNKKKVEGSVSSKWKKYYGFKKGKFPSHQHNTRFRVVCYHCENLMADNVTYMDHVEEVIEKSCPATKIKKLCKICFKAQTGGDLQQHIKTCHIEGSKYNCQICNINFSERKDMKIHMKKTHQGLTMPYICKICLYQTSFHADLKYHFITTHRGSKALLCHFCTKVLYSSRSFLSHFTKHYSRQMGVQCTNCKLLFLSHSAYKEHLNNDHQKFDCKDKDGLPPYKSFYLPKSTPQKTSSCKKLVGTMSSLNEEVVVVPVEEEEVKKAWKCLECGGSYLHLAEHLFTEHKCQNCPYITHCSSAFSQHVVAFHSSFQDAPALHPVKKSRVFGGQLLRCKKCGFKTAFATNMAKHIVCCPEGVSVIDSFDYLRTRALKEIAMRGKIADYSNNVPEVIAVESVD